MPSLPAFGPSSWPRVLQTLLLALAAALLCVWLQTPIPWMIGPLLA
ncbi:MAG: AbrB family transcriptional regulator, partial [Hydrogenophaga sp.]|nr:AbrB family transcriptional regulator [Hydrogenophaga sp.]